MEKCPRCNGEGIIIYRNTTRNEDDTDGCPRCKMTGEVDPLSIKEICIRAMEEEQDMDY